MLAVDAGRHVRVVMLQARFRRSWLFVLMIDVI